ncbi:hypothetical protein [Streptomyces sp. NPDC007205]|uniref:hypothetical protein n=1 Tax=Streptomyces sp. NPDC007205 TaxID=3154316 RepID=UPI0033F7C573
MVGRIVRRVAVLALGAVWWWAVLRITLGHGAGVLEGAVAAGGWGVSLLPVHCVPKGQAADVFPAGRWVAAWRTGGATRASPHPRSGEVSDRS